MKASKYSDFCLRMFKRFIPKQKEEKLIERNILLEQANIDMEFEEYFSMAIMNTLIGVIILLILGFILYLVVPQPFNATLSIIVPPVLAIGIAATFLYLPTYSINKRAANIDLYLPYAINFISSMAVAGISPAEIFTTLATIDVYGELQNEAKKIAKEINIMGIDNITALKHALDISPSRKFKAFLQGIIGTIQSGSDLHMYLSNIVEKYMDADLVTRKKDLDLLAMIAEVFVISVIAFPIFLVIILTTMGFFGGNMDASILILLLFSFIVLPFIYVAFYLLIESTSIEEITKIQTKKSYTLRQFYENNKVPIFILGASAIILFVFYGILIIISVLGYLELTSYLIYDFIFLAVLFLIGPIGMYKYIELRRKKRIQDRLPEFFLELGNSLNTGMTIFDAIKVAEKGHYGILTPEIKKMKGQLSWEISIREVFNEFAARMKSAIIQRLVITVNKGLMMGGNTPRIFKAAAREVDQVNTLEDQRKANMSIYTLTVIMCFFVFLAIILILDKSIFSTFFELQKEQISQVGGALTLSVVDPLVLKYSLFAFVYVQSIGAGLLAGFMTDGKLASGIRYSCVLGLVSFFVFKFLF